MRVKVDSLPSNTQMIPRDSSHMEQQRHLLESGLMADCSFIVGVENQKIAAHKLLLSRSSEVFYTMFNGSLPQHQNIHVTDITPTAFKQMLRFIYTEELEVENVHSAVDLSYASLKYMIHPLTEKCIDYVKDNLEGKDLCSAMQLAKLTDRKPFIDICIQKMQDCTLEVITSDSWLEAFISVVLTLIQQDHLNLDNEALLLSACTKWCKKQTSSAKIGKLRDLLNPMLAYIRIQTISPQQFVEFNEEFPDVFNDDEKYKTLAGLVNGKAPELKLFSQSNASRCKQRAVEIKSQMNYVYIEYKENMSEKHTNRDQRLLLTVKSDIVIKEVVYITRKDEREGVIDLDEHTYDEKIYVAILTLSEGKLVSTMFTQKVRYEDEINIILPEPCVLRSGNKYYLQVYFYNYSTFIKLDNIAYTNYHDDDVMLVTKDSKFDLCPVRDIRYQKLEKSVK